MLARSTLVDRIHVFPGTSAQLFGRAKAGRSASG
jgi:hypothetical protein